MMDTTPGEGGLDKTIRFSEDGSGDCSEEAGVSLLFLEGPRAGEVVRVERARTVIGRRDDADLSLPSRAVSKEHCVLTVAGDVVEIEDLGSTNGVMVNGARLQPGSKRRLFHGDGIRLAENLALLRHTGCFADTSGASRIAIDRDLVAQEVDQVLGEFARWTGKGGPPSPAYTAPNE
jgi:pSer/pThr/pTyr-binding forkhead associated (FHA) protein